MSTVRVMTYNIFMGGRKGRAVDEVVRAAAPDVLLVNESPKRPLRWRADCQRLAERWGMRYVVGGRPAGSNMVIVSPGVSVKSSGAFGLPRGRFQPRRGVAWAQLRVHGRLVGVISCHLSLSRDRRSDEMPVLVETAARLRGPVLVAGDLNESPGGPSWRRLRAAGFTDPGTTDWCTFPAEAPERRIDALLVRGDVRVTHHGDPGVDDATLAAASDHRPVLAVLELD